MLQTVKDACQFDPKAIDYALSDQIESLEDLVGHDPKAAEAFFRKTYVTGGLRTLGTDDTLEGFTPAKSRVVAISGRSISREKHLWGDIAEQLGKAGAFVDFYKGVPQAPNDKDWIALIGKQPALILLDDMSPYYKSAVTQTVGGGTLADVTTFAVSNL